MNSQLLRYYNNNHLIWNTLFFAILIAIIYGQCITYGLIGYDDFEYINIIKQLDADDSSPIWAAFSEIVIGNWHPVTLLSLIVDYKIYGENYGGYHLTNLLLHLVNTVLVWAVFYYLLRKKLIAFLVALVFCVHPASVEVVAWLGERKGILSATFSLLSVYLYLKYLEYKTNKYLSLSILAFLAGMLSKASIAYVPFLLLSIDYYKHLTGSVSRFNILIPLKEKIPYMLIAVAISGINMWSHISSEVTPPVTDFATVSYVANIINATGNYIKLALAPGELSIIYPYRTLSYTSVLSILAILAVITVLSFIYRKKVPVVFFGWLWFLLCLAPVSGIFQTGYAPYANRHVYLPMLGLFSAILFTLFGLVPAGSVHRKLLVFSTCFVVLIFSFSAYSEQRLYRSPFAIFHNAERVVGDDHLIYFALALAYINDNHHAEGYRYYKKATALKSNIVLIYQETGKTYYNKGEYDYAEQVLKDGLFLGRNIEYSLKMLAKIKIIKKQYQQALAYLDAIVPEKQGDPEIVKLRNIIQEERNKTKIQVQ